MAAPLELESTLTDRYQTTVPETVRRALGLAKRDKLHYSILPTGEVILTRAKPDSAEDPALSPFLQLLAQDIANHPERLQTLDSNLVQHIQTLVANVEIDLDAPLLAEDE